MATRYILWFALLIPVAPGCLSAKRPPLAPIRVIDAETKAPIPNALVQLAHANPRAGDLGKEARALTGADGLARVRSESKDEIGVCMEVSAEGYFTENNEFRPAAATEPNTPPPVSTVELFAGPRPTVDLLLPTGFHGLLKVDIRVDDPPPQRGQRNYSGIVGNSNNPNGISGTVQVAGSSVLKHGTGPLFQAHFADSPPLPFSPKGMELGLHFIRKDGDTHYFVVGTWDEASAIRKVMSPEPPARRGGGGGGGGGGRQGRGGGMSGGGGRGGMGGGMGGGGGGMGGTTPLPP